jgi:hypothetical protein
MTKWIEKYRGFEVEVMYLTDNNMYKDRGRLVDFGDNWIELQKGPHGGEVFLIPTTAIRLVKLVGAPARDVTRLLRPAAPSVEGELLEEERVVQNR